MHHNCITIFLFSVLITIFGCAGCNTPPGLKIILLGKAGSGRSAAANTILGNNVFEAKMSLECVTKHCEMRERTVEGRTLTVIDTPGLTCHRNDKLWTDIWHHLEPGPHVFLLVISVRGRAADEMRDVVKEIKKKMGKDVLCYIIILFTHEDYLGEQLSIEEYCKNSQFFRRLINSCGGRFHSFNNNRQDNEKVQQLLKKIDNLVEWNSNKVMYDRQWYHEAQRAMSQMVNDKW